MPMRLSRAIKALHVLMVCIPVLLCGGVRAGTPETNLPETHLRIAGGLADVSQFTKYEKPFWSKRVGELSGGRITAEISAFDRSGIRAQDMLRLIELGVVPFGTMLISASTDTPELGVVDLPLVSPDFASLQRVATAYRPFLERFLKQQHDIELLGLYTYPAQVLFCRQAFRGLGDLAGRRIRTSSVSQAELVEGLGAIPIVLPFAEIVSAVEKDVVDCAITGTLSGNSIGLHEVTTHIHTMAVTWGLSIFAANGARWAALAPEVQRFLRREVAVLEQQIWADAEQKVEEGIACNTGVGDCPTGRPGKMTLVPLLPEDAARLRTLISQTVLPGWLSRCGEPCADAWNATIGPLLSIPAPKE
jgi:TRAP-type C4-dicarboxylate transport system substrate-binding protein